MYYQLTSYHQIRFLGTKKKKKNFVPPLFFFIVPSPLKKKHIRTFKKTTNHTKKKKMNSLVEINQARKYQQLIEVILKNYSITPLHSGTPSVNQLLSQACIDHGFLTPYQSFPFGSYSGLDQINNFQGPSSPLSPLHPGSGRNSPCFGRSDSDEQSLGKNNSLKVANAIEKSTRITWNAQLQKLFLDAFEELGPNTSAKPILNRMKERDPLNTATLQRSHVSSHLQKHKKQLDNKKSKATGQPSSSPPSSTQTSPAEPAKDAPTTASSSFPFAFPSEIPVKQEFPDYSNQSLAPYAFDLIDNSNQTNANNCSEEQDFINSLLSDHI